MARTPKIVEDRREQILAAAISVFARKGFSRATNKDIAREAGITPGLIYHYFENKEALLNAIVENYSPLSALRSLPAGVVELPPEAFLHAVLPQILQVVESETFIQLIRVFLPEVLYNPEITPVSTRIFQQVTAFLDQYLTRRMVLGDLRTVDASLVSQSIISNVVGFVMRRQILRDPLVTHYTHAQIVDTIVDITFRGLLPR
ncbi:TetR/AcrR family transcriptional regulator [Dictyobacter formicarum]|uniref:TetR family transcriptional regulator n=1 Tax=Dictyobacter formicarum TaxID=2778368 RepID=A0ABQ3VSS7_9CHLR|nr:TetR/AcrR family transcriptional regulator [Dictyobacter formicarum]GHO88927.1 TetR family transcriptional regulator [Dictyobacter formicarum]